jgi:hypothetical protein
LSESDGKSITGPSQDTCAQPHPAEAFALEIPFLAYSPAADGAHPAKQGCVGVKAKPIITLFCGGKQEVSRLKLCPQNV